MQIKKFLKETEGAAVQIVRKWWRPVTAIWICLTMGVNGVFLPLAQWWDTGATDTDLMGLSALVTSVAAAFAVREFGKIKGSVE